MTRADTASTRLFITSSKIILRYILHWTCSCDFCFVDHWLVFFARTINSSNCYDLELVRMLNVLYKKNITYMTDWMFCWGSVPIVLFIVSWLEQTLLKQGCSSLLLRLFSDLHLTLNMFLWFWLVGVLCKNNKFFRLLSSWTC